MAAGLAVLERGPGLSEEIGGWMVRERRVSVKPERCQFKDIRLGEDFWATKERAGVSKERHYVKMPKGRWFNRSRREMNAHEKGTYCPAAFRPEEWVIRHLPSPKSED